MDPATQRLLTRSPLLTGLKRDLHKRLVAAAEVRELARRAPVWSAGTASAGLGLVRAGVLRETIGHGAEEVLVGLPGRGDWVGATTLLAGGAHHTDLSAHDESVVIWFPAAALEPLDASLARRLAAATAERCRRVESRLAETAYHTVEARLAATVVDLADAHGVRDSRGVIVNLRLTRRDLAQLAGTTRESTSAVVGRWQRDGVVETDARRLVVLDRERLVALSGRAAGGP
jgi:CRP-like cAMP-binding protein